MKLPKLEALSESRNKTDASLQDDELAVGFFGEPANSGRKTRRSSSSVVIKKSDVAKLKSELGKPDEGQGGGGWVFTPPTTVPAEESAWYAKAKTVVKDITVRNLPNLRLKIDDEGGRVEGGDGVPPEKTVVISIG